ncbi:hypothetical protein JCM8547_008845 [Rhodosporidiobolus lusitaniae]
MSAFPVNDEGHLKPLEKDWVEEEQPADVPRLDEVNPWAPQPDGGTRVRLPGIDDMERGLPASLGPFVQHPRVVEARAERGNAALRQYWQVICLNNQIPQKTVHFATYIMRKLYRDLPNGVWDRFFRHQIETYNIAPDNFNISGGSNTEEDPLQIHVPALLIPGTRMIRRDNRRFVGFAVPMDAPLRNVVPIPAPCIVAATSRTGSIQTVGGVAIRRGELNGQDEPGVVEIGNDGGFWKPLPLEHNVHPNGLHSTTGVATWKLTSTIQHKAGERPAPLHAEVHFILTPQVLREALEPIIRAQTRFIPFARPGPAAPVLRVVHVQHYIPGQQHHHGQLPLA